jgi:branched-chain amino acid transport system ATP-binding protein
VLKIDALVVNYGPVVALKGISLHVDEGEVVALVGPNGAGKSTTINSIAGIVEPSDGTIEFAGEPIHGVAPERIVRRGIALVPEGRRIFGTLTVAENLRLGATSRSDRATLDEELERLLTHFPILKEYFRSQADRLSGGEQQQLAIARALLSRPRLLLLDEPSFGLAPKMIDLVFETLSELKSEGATVLLVEQAASRAVAFADRSYVLNTGQIVRSGTREELEKQDLSELYLGVTA